MNNRNVDTRYIGVLKHVKASLVNGRLVIDPSRFKSPSDALEFITVLMGLIESVLALHAITAETVAEVKAARAAIAKAQGRDE